MGTKDRGGFPGIVKQRKHTMGRLRVLLIVRVSCGKHDRQNTIDKQGRIVQPLWQRERTPPAQPRFTVVELDTGLRLSDRTEVMLCSAAKILILHVKQLIPWQTYAAYSLDLILSGQFPMLSRCGLRCSCLYYTQRLGEQ